MVGISQSATSPFLKITSRRGVEADKVIVYMSRDNNNSVFYSDTYHPIQAGSIDGTDILPHDRGVYRAHLCAQQTGLYNPFGDLKIIGDPYCTLFVGRLSHFKNEDTLLKAMAKYGKVKNLRLVRHIVTGASRGYGFVEYETEREMRRAYEEAHNAIIDDYEIIADYNRQQLMLGWIPRRLGGGLGGKKESGQLRFGGCERPFRAPLRPIPYDDLMKLGIPPPPEGRYMTRSQVPPPPRRHRSSIDREESTYERNSTDICQSRRISVEREEKLYEWRSSKRGEPSHKRSSGEKEEGSYRNSTKERSHKRYRSHSDRHERR